LHNHCFFIRSYWMSDALCKIYRVDITDKHLPVRRPPTYVVTPPESLVIDERPVRIHFTFVYIFSVSFSTCLPSFVCFRHQLHANLNFLNLRSTTPKSRPRINCFKQCSSAITPRQLWCGSGCNVPGGKSVGVDKMDRSSDVIKGRGFLCDLKLHWALFPYPKTACGTVFD